jgi:hypothetical protein
MSRFMDIYVKAQRKEHPVCWLQVGVRVALGLAFLAWLLTADV